MTHGLPPPKWWFLRFNAHVVAACFFLELRHHIVLIRLGRVESNVGSAFHVA